MKGILKFVLGVLLSVWLVSCTPPKRLARLIKKNPELIARVDTITVKDTIFHTTERVFKDSVFMVQQLRTDTVIIREKNLTIRSVIEGEKIYISGECDEIPDTIYREIKVPYNVVDYKEKTTWQKIFDILFWLIIICGLVWLFIKVLIPFAKRNF